MILTATENRIYFWYNSVTGVASIWPAGVESNYINLGTVPPSSGWSIAAVGDFNGDGKSDIVWYNKLTGVVSFWPSGIESNHYESPAIIPVSSGWVIKAVGDFDGDGKSDLLWYKHRKRNTFGVASGS